MPGRGFNLSPENLKFCEYYAGGMTSTEAYMKAFNKPVRTEAVRTAACRLLKKREIHDLIIRMQEDVYKSMCLNAEKLAIKLAEMGFAEKNDAYYTPQIQLKALDMLQKQMGLQKLTNQTVITVAIDEGEKDEVEEDQGVPVSGE